MPTLVIGAVAAVVAAAVAVLGLSGQKDISRASACPSLRCHIGWLRRALSTSDQVACVPCVS
jgi:hypothetical protein